MTKLLPCTGCRKRVSEAAATCPRCGHPLAEDQQFQDQRKPDRAVPGWVCVAVILGVLGWIWKSGVWNVDMVPAQPTATTASAARPRTRPPAKPTQASALQTNVATEQTKPRFRDPRAIVNALVPVGYKAGHLQPVPGGLWQAVSTKSLRGGDVALFVSGETEDSARVVELEATCHGEPVAAARDELKRVIPIVMAKLDLAVPDGLAEAMTGGQEFSAEVRGATVRLVPKNVAAGIHTLLLEIRPR